MFHAIWRMLLIFLAFSLSAQVQAAVEVNRATQAELESIRGVGPGTSSKILAERQRAPFSNWDDVIDRVHGLGPKTAVRLSAAGLLVNGGGYVPSTKPLAKPSTQSRQPSVIAMSPGGGGSPSETAGSSSGNYIRWSGKPIVPSAQVGSSAQGKVVRVEGRGHRQVTTPSSSAIRPLRPERVPLNLRPAP